MLREMPPHPVGSNFFSLCECQNPIGMGIPLPSQLCSTFLFNFFLRNLRSWQLLIPMDAIGHF